LCLSSSSQQPIKTFQQREQEYAQARLRILGSAHPEEETTTTPTSNTNNSANNSNNNSLNIANQSNNTNSNYRYIIFTIIM